MMHWALFLTVLCVTCARAQAVACIDDSQCTSGYYCVTDLLACRPCLRCEDLNREPPKSHVSCIRSVVECGPCLKGLVDDRAGELGASCTEPASPDEGMPVYVWAVIACLILLFVLIALGAVIFMLRRTDTFKILACTSVQTPVLNGNPPSAPAPPPPYNYSADYAPVRPSSPLQQPAPYTEDASSPLVKRAPSCPGAGGDTRQSAGSQAALVYHNPAYVRNAQPPPSYDSAYSESEADAPFVPQDEDTMPSPWTPGTAANNNDNSGNESGATASSVTGTEQAGAVALRRPSRSDALAVPAKIVCVREDSNNNRGESSTAPRDEPPPAPAPAASVVINVLNVNSVHQLNDVTL